MSSRPWMRAVLATGVAAVLLVLTAVFAKPTVFGFAWLDPSAEGQWIVYPHLVRTTSYPGRSLQATFERTVDLAADTDLVASLRCVGRCVFEVGDGRVDPGRLTLAGGTHRLTLRATRADGPPAVAFALRTEDRGTLLVESDASWSASINDAAAQPARVADVSRAPPPAPLPAIPWRQVLWLVLGAIAALGFAEWRGATWRRWLLPLGAFAWVALFVANLRSLDGLTGFDVAHHVRYLEIVMSTGSVPSPSDGIQTYQPPLFYLLCAAWLRGLGLWPGSEASVIALRGLGLALGTLNLVGLVGCVRLVFPGRDAALALALLFGAALPLHLVLFQAFSNEVLVATLSTMTLWALLWSLRRGSLTVWHGLGLGLLAGAALLSKLSALVLVPVVLGVLVLQGVRQQVVLSCLFGMILTAGWYYVGVAIEFGTPFLGNWDSRVGFVWWQDPGFRAPGAYLKFGHALSDPWFAGFDSVWDGLYSTLFADGLVSGEPNRLLGPPWNHGLARVGVWLGLIPTALIALGVVRGVRSLAARPNARGLALAGLGVAIAVAFVLMTLRVPAYAQAKANYLTPGLGVLAVALAAGFESARERSRGLGRALAAGMLVWAFVSFAAFWVDPSAPETFRGRSERALAQGRPGAARALYDEYVESAGGEAPSWVALGRCRAFMQESRLSRAAEFCEEALERAPDDPDALYHAGTLARRQGDLDRAFTLFERLGAVAPLDERGPPALATLARRLGRFERAQRAARAWLVVDPGNPRAQSLLTQLQAGARRGS